VGDVIVAGCLEVGTNMKFIVVLELHSGVGVEALA
jgi:hypothetical protein